MPTHPSSPFSHAHTRTHHQPDSSPPGLAQWACLKASAYGSRVGWIPARRIDTLQCKWPLDCFDFNTTTHQEMRDSEHEFLSNAPRKLPNSLK